ncbi:MAG: hypothetical protein M3Z01_00045, partial [Thermoproteota archaeon]|nr:hypothetical protein [Thermoproteota archaeon]
GVYINTKEKIAFGGTDEIVHNGNKVSKNLVGIILDHITNHVKYVLPYNELMIAIRISKT